MRRAALGKDFQEDLSAKQRRIVAQSWRCYLKNATACLDDLADDSSAFAVLSESDCRRVAVPVPRLCCGLGASGACAAACGYAHTVILVESGALLSAGYGEKGQLGNGGRCPRACFAPVRLPAGLTIAVAQNSKRGALLACGLNHTAAVTAPGRQLYTWGLGVFGQLGLGHQNKESCLPGRVELPGPVVQLACGDNHTLVLTADGDFFAFGHRDAVGGQSHFERLPERKRDWSAESGVEVQTIFAGGTGSFATLKAQSGDRYPSLQAFGYNQKHQLGRYIAELECKKPGNVALPPLSGAQVGAFSAGSSHCIAVLDAPACCILPPDVGEAFFGTVPLLSALRGEAPYDVSVLAGPGDASAGSLGAHRCVLRARCPGLAARLLPGGPGAGSPGWKLDLRGHTARCVSALLEYLYTDHCRLGADVAAELRSLAEELKLERLMAGIAIASETDSMTVGMRWVRTPTGKWEQIEDVQNDLLGTSTYAQDLEALVGEGGVAETDFPDYVELDVRQLDGTTSRTLHAALTLLLAIDFFRAMLDGGFSEAVGLRLGAARVELLADDAAALVLCLRILATGKFSLIPDDPAEVLAVLVEAHRLQLGEIVAAAEASLGCAAAEGRLSASVLEALASAAQLYNLPRLAPQAAGAGPDFTESEA